MSSRGGGGLDTDSSVRLVNATSEYTTLDLYAGSDRISSAVASNSVGSHATIDADTYTFNLRSGGSTATAASTSREALKKKHQTLVAYTTGGALKAEYLSDEESAPSAGTAKVRVFNTAAADAGNIDLYLVNTPCAELQTSTSAAVALGVSGLQTGFTEVSAATGGSAYHLCVTAAGDKSALRLDVPALTLSNQQVATLIVTRSTGGVLLNGLLLTQQGALTPALNTSARIRVAANASGNGTVTASVGGTSLGLNYTSPAVGSYKLVPAGALALSLTVSGTTTAVNSLSAVAGNDYTLLVTGAATAPVATLIADSNTPSSSTAQPVKLRLVNGLNGTTASATLAYNYDQVGDDAASLSANNPSFVATSAALARLEASFGGTTLLVGTTITLETGKVYSLFLLGDLALPQAILRADR
ncbi:MAG: DUF4397 domain-containing protein [Burkholderiaceae bacterium]